MDEVEAKRADARAKAEARRKKILERQKDRLAAVTGTYADARVVPVTPQQPSSLPEAQSQDSAVASPAVMAAPDAAAQQQREQRQQELEDQQVAALMAAVSNSLQRAQAASEQLQAAPAANELVRRPAAAAFKQQPTSTAAPEPEAAGGGSNTYELPSDQQQQQAPLLLQLGPVLTSAVKQTQLVRLLCAVMLAYAALSGWELGMPPALLVVVTNLCIVAAALTLLRTTGYGRKMAAEQAAAAAAGDAQMPWRLRSFDFLTLVPGLRELLAALSGYQHLANAISEDTAAFLVAMGLITVTLAAQPQWVHV